MSRIDSSGAKICNSESAFLVEPNEQDLLVPQGSAANHPPDESKNDLAHVPSIELRHQVTIGIIIGVAVSLALSLVAALLPQDLPRESADQIWEFVVRFMVYACFASFISIILLGRNAWRRRIALACVLVVLTGAFLLFLGVVELGDSLKLEIVNIGTSFLFCLGSVVIWFFRSMQNKTT